MQFIDLAAQQKRIREKIDANISAVLEHGRYIMGPEIDELEKALGDFCGVKQAVSCASGTDALLLALMAHNVGPGDAILTSPFTFIATAEVISLLGATPVFVDIDPSTFNIDPQKIEPALNALKAGDSSLHPLPDIYGLKAKGIIAVDLFGLPADYERINAIAKEHGLFVIEDAAQSFGAEYFGKKAGSLADVACTSFFPAKPLGGYGDGGMCFTDDDNLADVMRSLRIHGKGGHKYDNVRIGINGRLDTLQAAVLNAKFDIFPEEVALRQEVAGRYNEMIAQGRSAEIVLQTPAIPSGYLSVWAQYSLLANNEDQRSQIQNRLKDAGIPTAVYYPLPLHLQTAFGNLQYRKGDFPVSEDFSKRIFSLPMHPYLQADEQQRIVDVIYS
ncbi:DegT/DnrJ/EryC1/StrS family aminotransferase [uncultured Desulfosarcina sp.]|uniref:DegT/DnrJ/EryC1/StrS family aminotransferase n=1 Tax=uncultured Desulfosarcina sp. TaxID=218289 RepID=UPI0029C6DFE7|nr:DegT/DnrJ/EryC1/StrS family aminotransferase [uncultured Desulfosarcina sp.]